MRKRTTPWQRICRAAQRGTGCRLDYADVLRLASDNAILTRADLDACPECERAGTPYTCRHVFVDEDGGLVDE